MNSMLIGAVVALIVITLILYNVLGDVKQHKANDGSGLTNYKNWYGPFYVNSEDPRFLVQKKQAGGYTVNFGNSIGIILTLLSLGLLGWAIYLGL